MEYWQHEEFSDGRGKIIIIVGKYFVSPFYCTGKVMV